MKPWRGWTGQCGVVRSRITGRGAISRGGGDEGNGRGPGRESWGGGREDSRSVGECGGRKPWRAGEHREEGGIRVEKNQDGQEMVREAGRRVTGKMETEVEEEGVVVRGGEGVSARRFGGGGGGKAARR